MATLQERLNKTLAFVDDDDVTLAEAAVHVYYFLRFEYAIWARNKHAKTAQKCAKKLNANLDVLGFRKQLREHL
jgi:hypothetical protein